MDIGAYLVLQLTWVAIYAVLCLGLNINWGLTGLFNVGIAGFFAVGAYTSAILTAGPADNHLGGYGLPFPVGWLAAMVLAAAVAWVVGRICLRLRADYLAIATIGIAEIMRSVFRNEGWLAGGSFGIHNIPRPFENLAQPWSELGFLALVLSVMAVIYWAIERGIRSPWGRTMRAIRENELAAAASGKNVERFRLQAFVYGSAVMGLGGAMTAHYLKFFAPEAAEPLIVTFLVWVMLVTGGSGNNRGAILGALVIWSLWTSSEMITDLLPADWATRAAYIRVFLIGLLLQIVLQFFSRGLLPEKSPTIRPANERAETSEKARSD